MRARNRALNALKHHFVGEEERGYTKSPNENLVPGTHLNQFEQDLLDGDGNELRMKFCAIHSSAALAVNTFAIFKDHPEELWLLGQRGVVGLRFEKRLDIKGTRGHPNLDIWIEQEDRIIAIESKLTEYLQPKQPKFSKAYEKLESASDPCWWQAFLAAKAAGKCHLDRAQLIKHYWGLCDYKIKHSGKKIILLYLYWQPRNWKDITECKAHDTEVRAFKATVAGAKDIGFKTMTYTTLWKKWSKFPELYAHTSNLQARYKVRI